MQAILAELRGDFAPRPRSRSPPPRVVCPVWPRPASLRKLPQRGEVIFEQLYTGSSLADAEQAVRDCIGAWLWSSRDTLGYKIGIALDPERRWSNLEFGYAHDQEVDWFFMHVVCRNRVPFARRLERRMTDICRPDRTRCYNFASGGGGISNQTEGACYVYVVFCVR